MYNHNKAQQSKNRVHISWDILYDCNSASEIILLSYGEIIYMDRSKAAAQQCTTASLLGSATYVVVLVAYVWLSQRTPGMQSSHSSNIFLGH